MSFNKRIFNMELLVSKFRENPTDAIENVIGKTDGFIFEDDLSAEIICMWLEDKEDEANKLLEEYVSGIIA
jgi:hypothetical protein